MFCTADFLNDFLYITLKSDCEINTVKTGSITLLELLLLNQN
jgi:hypothetical protein